MMGKDEDCSSDEETPSPTCSKTKSSFTQHNDARTKKRARSSPPVAPTQFSKCYRKRRQVTDIHVAQFGADREILESMMNAAKSNDDQERATGGNIETRGLSSWRGRDDSTLPIAEKQWSDDIRGSQHQQGYNLGTRTAAHRTNDDYRGRAPPLDRGQEETENLDGARRMTPPSLASRTSVDAVASLHHRGPLLVPSRPEVFQQQPQGSLIASDASSSSSLALRLAAIHAHQEALSSRRRRDSISSQSLPPPSASISQHYPFMDWRDLQVGAFTRHGAAGLSSLVATTQNPGATSRDFLVSSLVAAAAPTYSTRPNDFHDGVSRLVGITNLTSLGRRPYAAIELRESDDRVPLHHKGLDRRNAFTSIDQARGSCNTKAFASEPVGHNVGHGVASMSGAYPHLDRRILLESRDGDAIPNVPRSFHVSTTHGHTSRLSDDEGQARYSRQSMNDRKELKKKDAPSISTATPPDDNAEEDPVVRAARLGSGADMNTTIQNQRSRILFVEGDEHYLTEYQCLLRKQLEVFEAGPNDIRGSTQGRNVPISPGQVGLRCRHCANLPLAARTKGAVYYSQTIEGMYQIAQNMSKVHLCQRCYRIPPTIQSKLISLKNDCRRATGGKEYWTKALITMGVYEDGSILRLMKNPSNPKQDA